MSDLEDFFDDVDKVAEKAAVDRDDGKIDDDLRPTKKQKTDELNDGVSTNLQPAVPVRPLGVVVAAASSYKAPPSRTDQGETSKGTATNSLQFSASPPAVSGTQQQHGNSSGDTANNGWLHQHSHGASPNEAPFSHATTNGSSGPQGVTSSSENNNGQGQNSSKHVRTAGGKTWVDHSLDDWPDNDFRIFVGNLAAEVGDAPLYEHFTKYASLQRAKIVRNHGGKKRGESKGYGFVSFADALDCAKAIREMDQTWLGGRPIRIKRSTWKDRELKNVRKSERENKSHQKKMKLL